MMSLTGGNHFRDQDLAERSNVKVYVIEMVWDYVDCIRLA
jgi:hypothetical protein